MGLRKTLKKRSFYDTINQRWLSKTHIPATETRIMQSYFMGKEINKELDSIIDAAKEGPIEEIRQSIRKAEGKIPVGLSAIIQLMQTMTGPRDISERIGWMCRNSMNAPLSIYIGGDPRDHTRCRVFIEEGNPSIGIPEYWLDREHTDKRKEYAIYCNRLASIVGIPNLSMGFEAEEEMAHQYPRIVDLLDTYNRINSMTWSELTRKYKTIDWSAMFVAYGLNEEDLPNLTFIVTSPSFVRRIQTRMESWSIDRWRGWFSLVATQWLASASPHGPLRAAWFAFKKFMQGIQADLTNEKLRNELILQLLPQTIGHMWTSQFCPVGLQKEATKIVKSIQAGAAVALRSTPWLSDKTKKEALKKLRLMDVQLAWPAVWDDTERGCTLNDKSLIENLLTISGNRADVNIKKLRGNCGKRDLTWDRPAYEVNAFYYPEQNRFVLPAAILRPPFYDPKRSVAWNYGAIGATIGHELSHAFDSDGRKYDEHGNLRNWWTATDSHEYKRRAAHMQRVFDNSTYRGLDVDGELTLVENIADLGGLEFALIALRSIKDLTKEDLREFFTAYTVSWQSKDRYKKAVQLLQVNVHAPPKLRVDLIVAQFDEWYEAFDIPVGHPQYVAPNKRIKFFGPNT